MHLLATQAGTIEDGSQAVDLAQSPGDIIVLSAADTELACLAQARALLPQDFPKLRLANFLKLQHPLSVDLYVENIIANAKLVVIRILGGDSYWRYGLTEIESACRARHIPFALVPGDDKPDAALEGASSVRGEPYRHYLAFGGVENARAFLGFAARLIGDPRAVDTLPPPRRLPNAGLYWPGVSNASLDDLKARWPSPHRVVPIFFYRAMQLSGALAPIDALISALLEQGLAPLPIYIQSLKDSLSIALIEDLLGRAQPEVILNCTSFATSVPGGTRAPSVLEHFDCIVLQVVFASVSRGAWAESNKGLPARDVAMNVALPEVDGRVLSRAVAFKSERSFSTLTECPIVVHEPVADRVAFVAQQAAAWSRLRRTNASQRRIALIFANYPNRDGRLGNGVGLDTPASALAILKHLEAEGYDTGQIPPDAKSLMRQLGEAPSNALGGRKDRAGGVLYPLSDYKMFFSQLPQTVRDAVLARCGSPKDDPYLAASGDAFRLSVTRFGSILLAVQPARGYNIDPLATYHDPALVPPHYYLAFYAWLRTTFNAHAVVHLGKHGNLEWLPGKSLGLSAECFPEAVLGQLPHLYPFIVNDPGEGSQAKRRASAVIVDHLTPPLTRAESYGPLRDLEVLVDEYYQAANLDLRRLPKLKRDIIELAVASGLDKDCGIADPTDTDLSITALDNYLCELKELQIRDGLHVFGETPQGRPLTDLLVALVRVPRGAGYGEDASVLKALCHDLALGTFDPLSCAFGDSWDGPKPQALEVVSPDAWRSQGDTVERLEKLAQQLLENRPPEPEWYETRKVLQYVNGRLKVDVLASGRCELQALSRGLSAQFVMPGPSGTPTRGRPDVLPTGRNFYSVDPRAIPTQTAWALGWKSAQLLVEDYRQ